MKENKSFEDFAKPTFYYIINITIWSKINCGLPTIGKILLPTSKKTLWLEHIATPFKYGLIGNYSIGLTIPGKLLSKLEEDT